MSEVMMMVYWICFGVGGLLLLFLGIAGHAFGGDGGDVDAGGVDIGGHDLSLGDHDVAVGGHDASGHHGIGPWSPIVLATFLTCFGATGVACGNFGAPGGVTALLASASGFVIAWLVLLLFSKVIFKMEGTSHWRADDVIDLEAEVITPIPADGLGEVAYIVGDSRVNSPARSETGDPIEKRAMVRISKIVGGTVTVRPMVDEKLRALKAKPPESQGPAQ